MDESVAARYWCHNCDQVVNPIREIELKCPSCQTGFIEEMGNSTRDNQDTDADFGSDRALSLWAPILLGMMGNPRRRRRFRRQDLDEDDDNDNDNDNDGDDGEVRHGGETELDRELDSIIRRRRRSSATILQLLQGIRAGMASESENSESVRDRERVILINPFNQTIIVQGSYDSSQGQNQNQNPVGSLGDYFIGPGLDLLLQHLAENDPNRYGTPPAQKEAIEAMPTVTIKENLQCSVCLDDFEMGGVAKEMPCKHKFHTGCILPWLELHSSCPVCRFQIPADDSKLDSDRSRNRSNRRESGNGNGNGNGNGDGNGNGNGNGNGDGNGNGNGNGNVEEEDGEEGRNGRGSRFSFSWPFHGLFSSSSGSQTGGGNSSSTSSSSSSASPHGGGASRTDEN